MPVRSVCVAADSCNVTTTGCSKEVFSVKNKPPDTRKESEVSKLRVSCPAMEKWHWGKVRCIYSSDPHKSVQPSSSYEDTCMTFMGPFSEWNCCKMIDSPTMKLCSPDTLETLSPFDTFAFAPHLPACSELFKSTPQMNNLADEYSVRLID